MSIVKSVFSSRLTTVLTLIGVAVGLGNVWRFPYMMGSYGGSAFLAIYLVFTLLLAIPALMAEMHLGKRSRNGTVGAFRHAFGNPTGTWIGYLLVTVITISASYYGIIVSSVVFSTGFSLAVGFSGKNIDAYNSLLANPSIQFAGTFILILVSLLVVDKGLNKGIEWISRRIIPFFLMALIYIIIHTLTLPGAIEKLILFLKPNFSVISATEIFAALGQAFFSVGLGGTFVVVYSGYMKDNEQIPGVALYTGLGDLGSSMLISLFLVPSILIFNLDMASGPGLIFSTLPRLFEVMPGGRFVGTLFLLSISLVAFLSLVAAHEVAITSVNHEVKRISRRKIILVCGLIQSLLIIPSILNPDLIAILDLIFGSGMQVFGSLMAVIGITWFLKSKEAFATKTGAGIIFLWTKWVIPIILTTILISYIYETIS
jgi:NSS family neurotransmitter:Na+ symporter